MTYTLTIRPKSAPFRARPNLAALRKHFGAAYHLGSVGDYLTYCDAPPAPDSAQKITYMVYGGAKLGRGFNVIDDQRETFKITTPLPTTSQDLEDMFTFAGMLAELLGARALEAEDGRAVPKTGMTALFAEVSRQNAEVLRSFAATAEAPLLSCVRMPLYLPEALCRRITAVPPPNGVVYLSTYLAEKQAPDYIWLCPVISQSGQGERTGTYTFAEASCVVIPKAPYVPAGQPACGGKPPARWQVRLASHSGAPLGAVPYERFIEFLEDLDLLKPFDERHWLVRGLSLNRMRMLAGGFNTQSESEAANG